MVLGLRSKHKKSLSVKIDYIVHVQEIKPWPPSESLRSVKTISLQWENGNQSSGSFLSTAEDSGIVFNKSFVLPLILYRDKKSHDKFQKNYLEFSLKDKAKGQVLGTALVNLADYGVIGHNLSINALINLKKSSNKSVQPALIISLEPVEKRSASSSPSVGLSKQASLDNDDFDPEIASFTDDDASTHSSRTASSSALEVATSSPSQNEKNENAGIKPAQNENLPSLSTNASSDTGNHVNDFVSLSKFSERSLTSIKKNSDTPTIRSSHSFISSRDTNGKSNTVLASFLPESVSHNSHEPISKNRYKAGENTQQSVEEIFFERFTPKTLSADNYRKNVKNELEPEAVVINGGSVEESQFLSEIHTEGKVPGQDITNGSQKNCKNERKEPKGEICGCKNEWKTRIEMLEEELREAAAIEMGLYSVVAEHASSGNKIHAPARRLSRFYTNACKSGSQAKRASAARAAVSGLVLVSKACGNDVPRLTFWLSNSIMLRAIVSQIAAEVPYSSGLESKFNSADLEGEKSKSNEESDELEDVSSFIIALEKVESWLFSRIVESLWWQTFTPHMQPTVAKGGGIISGSGTKKSCGRRNSLVDHGQGNFSLELWKKAFKDACERLCPVRAGGHECGCLTVLVRLVMEQLVNRLDVAMFNAILRESAEEMPTDPLSDPITDSKVLPIPAGKSSFGAGVELKNAIGNWSRWLTDLFGLEDDSTEHSDVLGDNKKPKSFKAFRLLHALSDLMMLPFGILAEPSTRKQVCPTFGPTIIKRVLNNFVQDEFCPDPIPQDIIEALDTEEISDISGDLLTSFPCSASPTKYSPPSAALLTCVGEVGSQVLQSSRLSTLKKSYTSDDELDELDSPLASIFPDSFHSSSALAKLSSIPKETGGRNVVRYQLLREIWKDDE
ncbi:hypothetical protein BUALT_Bualt05G0168600 [Buddleja alternifolia]|uniref:C2 NT-type domain-containing protein n=1 Tax=Buddleja alternifolia TaxID=168488 RepID=A0AAV6XP74_9LAMI|nr:hypothetical protein BUALT_Bualt05G0168600 [Buddleja alternifolia]